MIGPAPRDLLAAIDLDEAFRHLESLVRIPSPTGAEADLAAALASYLRSAGFQDVQVDEHGNVLLRLLGTEPGPSRLLITHTDSAGIGAMARAFEPERMAGEAVGRRSPVLRGLGA